MQWTEWTTTPWHELERKTNTKVLLIKTERREEDDAK